VGGIEEQVPETVFIDVQPANQMMKFENGVQTIQTAD
jgi:hypothetical protein